MCQAVLIDRGLDLFPILHYLFSFQGVSNRTFDRSFRDGLFLLFYLYTLLSLYSFIFILFYLYTLLSLSFFAAFGAHFKKTYRTGGFVCRSVIVGLLFVILFVFFIVKGRVNTYNVI